MVCVPVRYRKGIDFVSSTTLWVLIQEGAFRVTLCTLVGVSALQLPVEQLYMLQLASVYTII